MLRLCSSSLSRQQILKEHKIPFIQCDNNFDEETLTHTNPKNFVYNATLKKYKNALHSYGLEMPLLVADTVIDCMGNLQRKAKNKDEARLFLHAQSGNSIEILTCMILHSRDFYFLNLSQTHYDFVAFDAQDIENYLQSNQWQNKAGAVMVEEFHQKYIKKQIGNTSNAMGLHFEALKPFLENL